MSDKVKKPRGPKTTRVRDPSKEEALTVAEKLKKIADLEKKAESLKEDKQKLYTEKKDKDKVVNNVFNEIGQNLFYAGPCVVSKVSAKNHRKDTMTDTWEAVKKVLGQAAHDELKEDMKRLKEKYDLEAEVVTSVSFIPKGGLRKPRTKKQKVQ